MAFAFAASSRNMSFGAGHQTDVKASAKPLHRHPVLVTVTAVLTIMGMIAARENIVRMVPRSAVLFSAMGMPVNLTGLEIGRVTARTVMDNGRRVLIVDGDVGNITSTQQTIPALQVAIRSGAGAPLYVWSTRPPRQKLGAGERAAFSARLASPPEEGADVIVTLDRAQSRPAPEPAPKKSGRISGLAPLSKE